MARLGGTFGKRAKISATTKTQTTAEQRRTTQEQQRNLGQLNDLIRIMQTGGGFKAPAPTFTPVALPEVNVLRAQQAKLRKLAEDPLGDVGLQQTLQAVAGGLRRATTSALGAAKGRAAQTGQAGFTGALAGTAAQLEGQRAATLGETRAKLAGDLAAKSREQDLAITEAILQAQLQGENIASQRAQITQAGQLAALQAQAAAKGQALSALGNVAGILTQQQGLLAQQESQDFGNLLRQQELALSERQFQAGQRQQQFLNQLQQEQRKESKSDKEFQRAVNQLQALQAIQGFQDQTEIPQQTLGKLGLGNVLLRDPMEQLKEQFRLNKYSLGRGF